MTGTRNQFKELQVIILDVFPVFILDMNISYGYLKIARLRNPLFTDLSKRKFVKPYLQVRNYMFIT